MRLLIWLLRVLVFLLLLVFLSRNSGVVDVRLFLDSVWSVPLSMLMLLFFAVGALLGVTATMATLLRQRRELTRLRQRLGRLEDFDDAERHTPSSSA